MATQITPVKITPRPITPVTKKPDDPQKIGVYYSSPLADRTANAFLDKGAVSAIKTALATPTICALWVSANLAAETSCLPDWGDMVIHFGRVVPMKDVEDSATMGWMRCLNTPFAIEHRDGNTDPLEMDDVVIDPVRKEITFMNGEPTRVPLPL